MPLTVKHTGETIELAIQVKDELGNNRNLTLLDGYGFWVYQKDNPRKVIAKFSKNSLPNFDTIELISEATGRVNIVIHLEDTININEGIYVVEYKEQVDVDYLTIAVSDAFELRYSASQTQVEL